jgi:hypothetical protein
MTMLTITEHTDCIMEFGLYFHVNSPSLKLHVKFPLVHSTSGIITVWDNMIELDDPKIVVVKG